MRKHLLCKARLYRPMAWALLLVGLGVSPAIQAQTDPPAAQPQTDRIEGQVLDDDGSPLPGISVVIKGRTRGTTTNDQGKFSLQATPADALVFSGVGFDSQEIRVGNQRQLNVVLQGNTVTLEGTVVVGYGTQKKANLTGAVSTIDARQLEARPVQNVGQALQGLIPGLNLQASGLGGELNNPLSVNIRGAGTIGNGSSSSPLILVDGMEARLNAINPQDIASISVLKDAAAASIYGSRAPFGVILITTKSGGSGKTSINYNNTLRMSQPMGLPTMLDSKTFAYYFNEAATNDGQGAIFSQETLDRIAAYQAGTITTPTVPDNTGDRWQYYTGSNANTDWFREFYRKQQYSQEHNLSINGGNAGTNYYLSGNYLNMNGFMKIGGDHFKRYTATAKIATTLNRFMKLTTTTRWIREDFDRPYHQGILFYHNISRRWPTVPLYDENGHYTDPSEAAQLEDGGRYRTQVDQLYQQGQLVITPVSNWNITLNGNYRVINNNTHQDVLPAYGYDVKNQPYPVAVGGNAPGFTYVSEEVSKDNYFNANLFTDYSFSLANAHNFKLLAGFNSEQLRSRSLGASRSGLITPLVPTISTATENSRADNGGYQHWATAGFFGRINYNYRERYLLELNGRYDGSSRFLRDKRWNFFPAVSAGWNVASEAFWPLKRSVQVFKLRGSYGELGNQNTNSWYPFYLSMPIRVNSGDWLIGGLRPTVASAPGIVSSQLTWERVASWNIGFDLGMLNNRLYLNLDYYKRRTYNMVGPAVEMPVVLGTAVPSVNNAEMYSRGVELEVSWRDRIGSRFNYQLRGVLSDDRQVVTKYPNPTGSLNSWYEGRMFGEIWGYTTVGIAQTQEQMNQHLAKVDQSTIGNRWQAGDIMYADVNQDGKIDGGANTLASRGDSRIIGNTSPRYRYSFDLSASYGGFDVRVFLQGVGKRDWMPDGPYFWGANGGQWQSAGFAEHMDFFRDENSPMVKAGVAPVNTDAYFPRPYFNNPKNIQTQTRYLQNAAYMRVKNVQIGYTLPTSLSTRIGVQRMRLFVSGENLLTFSKMISIFDPESVGLSGWSDGKTYPYARVLAGGINVTF